VVFRGGKRETLGLKGTESARCKIVITGKGVVKKKALPEEKTWNRKEKVRESAIRGK